MESLGPVLTVWDETRVLDARIGEYVLLAQRHGRDWYVGAMTNWIGRELGADFSFLPAGTFSMDVYQDGVNADRYASDYVKTTVQISGSTTHQDQAGAGRRLGSEDSPLVLIHRGNALPTYM